MKRFLYFTIAFIIFSGYTNGYTQIKSDSANTLQQDTPKVAGQKAADTVRKKHRADTTKLVRTPKAVTVFDTPSVNQAHVSTTSHDSLLQGPAVTITSASDTSQMLAATEPLNYRKITDELLLKNRFINVKDAPAYFIEEVREPKGKEFLFYTLCIIVLILGLFRTFYSHYFNNLFRVFFNTSLRQTQLTDQLLQAKLPSFILNIFFALAAGIYIWLLFVHFHPPRLISKNLLLPFCIIAIAALYFVKFCILKFMGWMSDIRPVTDNYIFVIFLINKITGILLVPFIIVLAFSMPQWISAVTTVSLLVLGLFFLSRYIKSYGAIERKLPLNPFHFIIYIVGAEILPLVVLYKVAIDYLV